MLWCVNEKLPSAVRFAAPFREHETCFVSVTLKSRPLISSLRDQCEVSCYVKRVSKLSDVLTCLWSSITTKEAIQYGGGN